MCQTANMKISPKIRNHIMFSTTKIGKDKIEHLVATALTLLLRKWRKREQRNNIVEMDRSVQ